MPEITTIIAVYGAVLATLGFILSLILGINEIRKGKPKLEVKLRHATLYSPDYKPSEPLLSAEILNKGSLPVVLSSCGWLNKDNTKSVFLNPYHTKLPHTLKPGRSVSFYLAVRWIRDSANFEQTRSFFVQSEIGKIWKSRLSKKLRKSLKEIKLTGWKILWNEDQKIYLEEYRIPPNLRGQFK